MEKIKNVISFVENLLGKLRKLFVNTLTVLFLMLIIFGFLSSLGGSLFESDKVETEDQILYLEPNGVIVDKAITTNDPFVLDLWRKELGHSKIKFLSDGNQEFLQKTNLIRNHEKSFMGDRLKRSVILIDNLKILKIIIDRPGELDKTTHNSVLNTI